MSTKIKTFDTAAGPIEAGRRYLINFDAREPTDADDYGTIDGQWTGEVDYVPGKITIRETFGRPDHYLFPDEIVELLNPDEDPEYRPQLPADQFLKLPPKDWDRVISAMKAPERRMLADVLTDKAKQAACAAAYASARAIGRDHQYGVKERNRVNTAVRKAIGYSYPKDDLNF